ncbi:MAG TPA: transcriptional regulator [Cytophagales bacterium]|nr:transcriptional regulator [Cytophagales bacterium]
MEVYTLKKDIHVYCITASSFPDGIKPAFDKLHEIAPIAENRTYYGISSPERGKIKYRAAANEIYDGELNARGMQAHVIKKGKYLLIEIKDFMNNLPGIEKAFKQLTNDKRIDPHGECVEWYKDNKTCRCMVRMKTAL